MAVTFVRNHVAGGVTVWKWTTDSNSSPDICPLGSPRQIIGAFGTWRGGPGTATISALYDVTTNTVTFTSATTGVGATYTIITD